MPCHWLLHLAALLALGLVAGLPARAAQDYDSCTGYIDSVPATITAQGTWCLRGSKFTSQTSGAAINVLTDNVTIDCNHFRLSGLGAGAGTDAIGITAGASRISATLRRCRIQGFKYGVVMHGANHLIESNRFELNTFVGIYTRGDYHVIRGNEVLATGGRPSSGSPCGINAYGVATVVAGNTVDGVSATEDPQAQSLPCGIFATGVIADNYIGNLHAAPEGVVRGITTLGPTMVRGNTLVQAEPTNGIGIHGNGVCRDNSIFNFSTGMFGGTCSPVVANYAFGTF